MVSRHRAPAIRRAAAALLLVACAGLGPPAAAALNALLERNSVGLGESVRLVLETDGRVGGSGPDLSALEGDFEVLTTSRSTQVQIADGKQSATTRWVVELLPRRAGELLIPAIAVGAESSRPLTLQVTPAPAGVGNANDIYMEAEIDPGNYYTRSQLIYRVRLYSAVPVLGGAISPPEAPRAEVQRIGEDVNFSAMRDGRRYEVLERRYAVFPQEAGRLTVGAATFTGQVGRSRGGVTAMDRLLNRGRRVRAAAAPVEVTVLPARDGFDTAEWLPARDLRLSEDWPSGGREFRVGEPVTRVLRLEARGVSASHLELPAMQAVGGLRLYPDQPQRASDHDGEWLTAGVEQRIALMPTRAGDLVLPEIRLRWWDVVADRGRTAVLPARTITVLPAAADLAAEATSAALEANESASGPQGPAEYAVPWYWPASVATLALLWLATLLLLWRRPARIAAPSLSSPGSGDSHLNSQRAARHRVAEACLRNDAAAARAALFAFARTAWPADPTASLAAMASRLNDPELAHEFARIDRVLYAPGNGGAWSGTQLRQLLARLVAPASGRRAAEALAALPPLNPAATHDRHTL